jgi:hypothetical protein
MGSVQVDEIVITLRTRPFSVSISDFARFELTSKMKSVFTVPIECGHRTIRLLRQYTTQSGQSRVKYYASVKAA